ncbi:hypothetical protein JWG44_18470 [Leptospira sp. 201903071]|uniref:hypothetical protein n=1 Tax=Leptospira ainazelensis TaxID=2810034 RepID=UPI001963B445|nr:hypothetical protein [Leptospira ainazelensis]MBM9502244.1 hypothetical protein [Leptospira ainazelensis]
MADSERNPVRVNKFNVWHFYLWLRALPGSGRDLFLLSLAAFDVLLLLIYNSYKEFLPKELYAYVIGFDFFVLVIWGVELITKFRKSKDPGTYFSMNWYEVVGVIPFYFLRPFLLLRGIKIIIAFYKLGQSGQNLSDIVTREITFRFRDVIVDTIADAVFLHSLERVEEVMIRLDYSQLAKRAFELHQTQFNAKVNESLQSKFLLGELSRIPFMGEISKRLGEDISTMITDVLENEVTGEIMKQITEAILKEMANHVKKLPIERITRPLEVESSLQETQTILKKEEGSSENLTESES